MPAKSCESLTRPPGTWGADRPSMLKIIVVASLGTVGCLHDGMHHGTPHYGYGAPVVVQPQPTYVDTQGRPVYADANGQPVYADGQPVDPASIVTQGTVTPTVVAPPVIYYDHHDHHDTHHDDHH